MSTDYKNWSRMTAKDGGMKLCSMVDEAESTCGWRHEMAARGAAAYSSAVPNSNIFQGLLTAGPVRTARSASPWVKNKQKWNFAKAIVRTLRAKLTMENPKTQHVATDASWEVRRQGVWADRWVEGNQHLPQETFQDTWDMSRHGVLVAAACTGTVGMRVEPDFVGKRVRKRLLSSLNSFVDPGDFAHGVPLTTIDVQWENAEFLCEDPRWKGRADDIMSAATKPTWLRDANEPDFGTPMVKVISAWRSPFGSFKGREAVLIPGKEPLLWQDWEFDGPPIAWFRVQRPLGEQFWSENFIDEALDALWTANSILRSVDDSIKKLSQTYIIRDSRSIPSASVVLNALNVVDVPYDGEKGGAPNFIQPAPINDAYRTWLHEQIDAVHKLLGVDQMHVSGERPQGIHSGRGFRLLASLFAERFSDIQRGIRQWVAVDSAKLDVRAARMIGKEVPDWKMHWPGADFDAEVGVDVLNYEQQTFTLRPYDVGERKNTPADRAEFAEELHDKGLLTDDQYDVIQNEGLDVPGEMRGSSTQRRFVAKLCDKILHGPEELIADERKFMAEEYTSPPAFFTSEQAKAARAQACDLYLQAMIDDVPQNRRSLLRRFVEDLDMLIMQKDQAAAMQGAASVAVKASPSQVFPGANPNPNPGAAGLGAMNGGQQPNSIAGIGADLGGIPAPTGLPS